MNTRAIALASRFAEDHPEAHTIHVEAYAGDTMVDAGDFESCWGRDRPEGVHDWLWDMESVDRVRVSAMRPTGVRVGPDDEWETTTSVDLS